MKFPAARIPRALKCAPVLLSAFLLQGLLALVAVYRYAISPMLGRHCRYHPSCSEYTQEALHRHGAYFGTGLALKRVCRCHPWHPGGYDPVP